MVICLEQCADLHMAQLMPLPLTVSCFSKIQIGFTFLVPAHPGQSRTKGRDADTTAARRFSAVQVIIAFRTSARKPRPLSECTLPLNRFSLDMPSQPALPETPRWAWSEAWPSAW